MAKTKLSHRLFFGFLAALFLVTAFGASIWFIFVLHQEAQQNKAAEAAQHLSACTTKAPPANVINVKQKGSQLQGTQLADFTPCKVNQLQAIDIKQGTGAAATASSTVTVDYTGAVAATGTIFQSSLDTGQPATFPLNGVIPGWTQGIPGMKEGGIRRLLIPAALAYGANPPQGSGIPANADLVFDITLHKVTTP